MLRPELVPVAESCAAELALHEALLENPRLAVPEARLAALADADARDNYRALLAFRDRLVAAPTIEAAYLDLLRRGAAGIPPLFLDQLVHVILRHLLRDCGDPLRLRAAELLFREQKVTIQDGRVDAGRRRDRRDAGRRAGLRLARRPAGEQRAGARAASSSTCWTRPNAGALLVALRPLRHRARPRLRAAGAGCAVPRARGLGRALHRCGGRRSSRCSRSPTSAGSGTSGSTVEASALLNDLYEGRPVDEERRARLLALFRLEFRDPDDMLPRVRGRPVYLGLAMTAAARLKLKPQNLLVNLPLGRGI